MAAYPEVIYCADGNKSFAQIAIDAGWTYGAQLPRTVYFTPEFADQKWKKPDFEKYMAALNRYRPRLATVLDFERWGQFARVIWWAVHAAQYVSEAVIIIPKVPGSIPFIPHQVGGKPIRLGYSVPTSFSGTPVPVWEFGDRPVHLLGGSPKRQFELTHYLNVVSVDCNYHLKMATKYNQYFEPSGRARYANNRWWPALRESNNGQMWGDGSPEADAPYEAFRRSCQNIMKMWQEKPAQ